MTEGPSLKVPRIGILSNFLETIYASSSFTRNKQSLSTGILNSRPIWQAGLVVCLKFFIIVSITLFISEHTFVYFSKSNLRVTRGVPILLPYHLVTVKFDVKIIITPSTSFVNNFLKLFTTWKRPGESNTLPSQVMSLESNHLKPQS